MLAENLLPMDIEIITSSPLSISNMQDTWGWHFEKSGSFTVRSMYRLLVTTMKTRKDWFEGRPASIY
jgi:hypothetical protein